MKTLMSFLFVCFSSVVLGQSSVDTSKAKIDKYCEQFMATFSRGYYSKAIQTLKQDSFIDEDDIDKLDTTLNDQMVRIRYAYGSIISYELVDEKKINNSIARRRYLLKFKRYFVIFDFTIYNNGSGWAIVNFDFNSNNKMLF